MAGENVVGLCRPDVHAKLRPNRLRSIFVAFGLKTAKSKIAGCWLFAIADELREKWLGKML